MSGYAAEKLGEAVHDLALGAGRIKERLEKAAGSVAGAVADPEMPANLRAKYDLMWARLTAVAPQRDEGSVRATPVQLSEEDACEIAAGILDLWYMAKR